MKKILALLMTGILVFSFSACGDKGEAPDESTSEGAILPATEEMDYEDIVGSGINAMSYEEKDGKIIMYSMLDVDIQEQLIYEFADDQTVSNLTLDLVMPTEADAKDFSDQLQGEDYEESYGYSKIEAEGNVVHLHAADSVLEEMKEATYADILYTIQKTIQSWEMDN